MQPSPFVGVLLRGLICWGALGAILMSSVAGRAAAEPSVHDVMAAVRSRLVAELGTVRLARLDLGSVEKLLTPQERADLGQSFIAFELDHPARVSVLHITRNREVPFWLGDQGFAPEEGVWIVGGNDYRIWTKSFPAGPVRLGVPSLGGRYDPYFVAVRAAEARASAAPLISHLYPGQLRQVPAVVGERPYADSRRRIEALPESFAGATVVATLNDHKDVGRLVELYRLTKYASDPRPDQITLTWAGDPRYTQAVRWRTRDVVQTAVVAYAVSDTGMPFNPAGPNVRRSKAKSERMETPDVANDPVVHIHKAELTGLLPDRTYHYAVGDGSPGGWSEPASFTTAPAGPVSFSFVYMGDAQNGLETWGRLVQGAHREHPAAAFYVMAGDLINSGQERDDWDDFFGNAGGVFEQRPLVPTVGNHEYQGGHPTMYLKHFALPDNGAKGLERGLTYAFEYSNALFVVLDSNAGVKEQVPWLEKTLRDSSATWKFVVYHHPAYASRPGRSYPEINQHWVPLFDRYHVDLALQGHDHAYLRTHPIRDGQPVAQARDGTTYLLTVAGTKMYPQGNHAYTAVGFVEVPTYQVLDLRIEGNRLSYRAFDLEEKVRDEFVIEK